MTRDEDEDEDEDDLYLGNIRFMDYLNTAQLQRTEEGPD